MEINYVSKKYGDNIVLKDICFALNKREVVGLVGRNGAGKSTLMKIMAKTITKFEGSIVGEDVGYFIESPKLLSNKTGMWHLKYFSTIFNNNFNLNEFEQLLRNIELSPFLEKKTKEYSLGTKQKLGVVISLLNNPEYVVLDEPTNGMDIDTSILMLEEIKKFASKNNIGVLISSHKLEDIEMVCDRVLFLDNGTIVADEGIGTKKEYTIILNFENQKDLKKFVDNQQLGNITGIQSNIVSMETSLSNVKIFNFLNYLNIQLIDYSSNQKTLRTIYMDKISSKEESL